MAMTNLGRVSFTLKGAYQQGTAYRRLDVVSYGVDSYVSREENNTALPTDASKWLRLTNVGDSVSAANTATTVANAAAASANDAAASARAAADSGVRTDTAQELSEEAQATARDNIAAAGAQALADLTQRVNDIEYEPVNITSLGFSVPSNGTAEIGSTVNAVTLTWALAGVPVTLTLNNEAVPLTSTSKALTGLSLTSDTTYTLKATDAGSPSHAPATATKTATLLFYNNIHYGAAATPATINSAFVTGLASKVLTGTKGRTISVNAGSGQYIWYALPKRLGTCNFNVGGFDGGFEAPVTVSVTNASGHTEDYYVYRTTNAGLGSTTVTVK